MANPGFEPEAWELLRHAPWTVAIGVMEAGVIARPGGMLPMLDGMMSYAIPADPADATHSACRRCGLVQDGPPRVR